VGVNFALTGRRLPSVMADRAQGSLSSRSHELEARKRVEAARESSRREKKRRNNALTRR
jgi:hypothetical protein